MESKRAPAYMHASNHGSGPSLMHTTKEPGGIKRHPQSDAVPRACDRRRQAEKRRCRRLSLCPCALFTHPFASVLLPTPCQSDVPLGGRSPVALGAGLCQAAEVHQRFHLRLPSAHVAWVSLPPPPHLATEPPPPRLTQGVRFQVDQGKWVATHSVRFGRSLMAVAGQPTAVGGAVGTGGGRAVGSGACASDLCKRMHDWALSLHSATRAVRRGKRERDVARGFGGCLLSLPRPLPRRPAASLSGPLQAPPRRAAPAAPWPRGGTPPPGRRPRRARPPLLRSCRSP